MTARILPAIKTNPNPERSFCLFRTSYSFYFYKVGILKHKEL